MSIEEFKKLSLVALAATTLLAACGGGGGNNAGGSSDNSSSNNAAAEGKTELVFWHAMGGSTGEALQKLVDQYNESQDEVFVNAQYQGSYDETLTKLRSSASGSDVGADLVQVFEQGTTFMIDSGLTVPVQQYVDNSDFDLEKLEPNLRAYYTIDGALHSMPFNSSTPILYYNKDIFDKAGVKPEELTNLEAIIANADKLTGEGGAAMPMSMGIYGWYLEQFIIKQGEHMFNNENGRAGHPTEVVFDENGSMAKTLEMWKKGLDEGVLPNVGREGGQPEFVSGQSAITVGSTANLRSILEEVGGRFEVGTAYFPGVDAKDTHGVSIGGASLWMIESGDDAKKEATWNFIQFLLEAETQATWNADTGYFPVNVDAHETETFKKNIEEFPQFQTAIDQLHDSTPEDQGALSGVNQEARQYYEAELEKLLNGQVTVEEAVKNMADQTNAALENYNAIQGN
ncbi:ABC transporter substrate-binding protein [Aerococcus urinaehominis]|uniref:ABC transporter substrate-binding protein n=1 Tax=Aerococcus urinaehominis TaxID=128944 RepID=A0A0X8FKP5_9LACT|nr:ABC transporter substrate-binding protein [Aerococcus urinaehominis]AMB98854.1 ABC transporter substrate-binding protein [Aerococcus urinaehominis]SDM17196.1 sn-glycerol 3-phosphate transport system substrate-binding protein [Aerococcus urinaehominis]